MAKIKATAKSIKNAYRNIIAIGYCDLYYILQHFSPAYYTCGINGWNSDVYIINEDTVISTGYRPIHGKYAASKLIEEYNQKGNELVTKYNSYSEREELAKIYLNEFVDRVLKHS